MEASSLSLLDVMVLTVLGISAIFGMFRGFISSVLSLVGWFFSIYLTYKLYPSLATFFINEAKETMGMMLLGHVILLVSLLIFFSVLNTAMLAATGPLRTGFLDNIFGFLFGCTRGMIIIACFYMVIVGCANLSAGRPILLDDSKEQMPKWLIHSYTYTLTQASKAPLLAILPQTMQTGLRDAYVDLTNKGLDERFVSYAIDEMKQAISLQDRIEIESYREANSMRKSQFTLETEIIEKLLEAYDRGLSTGTVGSVDPKELERLRQVLKQRQTQMSPDQ